MRLSIVFKCIVLFLFFFYMHGCAITSKIPSKIDLTSYKKIGIVSFELENATGEIGNLVASKFSQAIKKAQPKARLIKLGSRDKVQKNIHQMKLDVDAVKAIGKRYDVDAVFLGTVSISDVKPLIEDSGLPENLKVQADANLSVTVQLFSTATGEILWENSILERQRFSHIRMNRGIAHFETRDVNRAYGITMERIVRKLTEDFRQK